ncbi:MAG: hypothetical protein GX144_04320 [Clostridiaceae bacterium]|jgi:phosphoribosyl 1,2-cyclic phosphate phosphodiesterase|nr:hypothetical protein [Clostridiaceae bacterium]
MKITFLGTGAAEMYPAIWCQCENCNKALKEGGRNIRGNSAALIDDDIMLDMNTTCFMVAANNGISLASVKHILVTHPHRDHLAPEMLKWRRMKPGQDQLPFEPQHDGWSARYTHLPEVTVYGSDSVWMAMNQVNTNLFSFGGYDTAAHFERIEDGAEVQCDDFSFIPVRANHKKEHAHNFILIRNGKTILYAVDTGGYSEEMLTLITSKKYDCVIMEGTFGLGFYDKKLEGQPDKEYLTGKGHMNLQKNLAMLRYLTKMGCWKNEPNFYITHLCPHFTLPHDDYQAMLEKHGIKVAYDGLQVNL